MPINSTDLHKLYLAYFGRPADVAGAAFYLDNPAWTLQSVAAAFSASPESQALFGAPLDGDDINVIYRQLFGRDAEQAGRDYWLGEIAAGRITPALAAMSIMVGAQGDDILAVNNKFQMSSVFFAALNTQAERDGYAGDAAAAAARAYLATVDATQASLIAAQANLEAQLALITGGLPPGSATEFTAGIDNIVGNDTDQTFTATFGGTGATYQADDKLDGGLGDDVLVLTLTAGSAPSITTTGVERVEIMNNAATGTHAFDASRFVGLEEFVVKASASGFAVDNLAQGQVARMMSSGVGVTFKYDGAATGATLHVQGANGSVLLGGAALTGTTVLVDEDSTLAAINLSGGLNKALALQLGGSALTVQSISAVADATVVVEGESELRIGSVGASIAEVDASAFSGTVFMHEADDAVFNADFVYKGGSGDDIYHVHGTPVNGSVDGGAGDNELRIHAGGELEDLAKFTNFDLLRVMNGATQNVANMSDLAISIEDGDAATNLMGLSANQAEAGVDIVAADGVHGLIEIALAADTGEDELSLHLAGTAALQLGPLMIHDIEILNLDGSADYTITGLQNAGDLSQIFASGSGKANVTVGSGASEDLEFFDFTEVVNEVTIDASALADPYVEIYGSLTHKNVITGSTGAGSVEGGAASDTVHYSGGEDYVYLGGAGDTVDLHGLAGTEVFGEFGLQFAVGSDESHAVVSTVMEFDAAVHFSEATTDTITGIAMGTLAETTGSTFWITADFGTASLAHLDELTFGADPGDFVGEGGFVILNTGINDLRFVFQDSDLSGAIDQTDLMIRLVGNGAFNNDQFQLADGFLIFTSTILA